MIRLAALLLVMSAMSSAYGASCDSFRAVDSPNVSKRGDNVFAAVSGRAANDVWAVGQFHP